MKAFLSVRKITMNMFSITMLTFPQYDTVLPSFPNQITIRTHLNVTHLCRNINTRTQFPNALSNLKKLLVKINLICYEKILVRLFLLTKFWYPSIALSLRTIQFESTIFMLVYLMKYRALTHHTIFIAQSANLPYNKFFDFIDMQTEHSSWVS